MSAFETFMSGDQAYLLLGILAVLVFAAIYFIATRGRRKQDVLPQFRDQSPGAARKAHESAVAEVSDQGLAPVTAPTVGDDVPADLSARPGGSEARDLGAPVHTIEEIQRPARKPLFSALSNTRDSFFGRMKSLFGGKPNLSPNEMEDLEEILYTSDLGPQTVQRLLGAVETKVKTGGGFEEVRIALKEEMLEIFEGIEDRVAARDAASNLSDAIPNGQGNGRADGHTQGSHTDNVIPLIHHGSEEYLEGLENLKIWNRKPSVLMVVGVNGAGKTTTIGKLARRIAQSGRKVLVAAGDTFRAAAGDQLKVWTDRASVEIFSPENVQDPSAVAYSAVQKAQSEAFDVVIVDTAGRLHTQKNLMEELKKMKRVMEKISPGAPHEVLLVLDANSGQNALVQAREFHQALGVTGVVLTKLDGTAKGGVAVGLACELQLPIKLIGVGEGIDDLRSFSSQEFVDSIL